MLVGKLLNFDFFFGTEISTNDSGFSGFECFECFDGSFQDSSRWFRVSVIMLVMTFLFDLTFITQILSGTGMKVTLEFALTILPVPVIDLFL